MKIKITLFAFLIAMTSCRYHGNSHISRPPNVLGLTYTQSEVTFEETYDVLRSSIEANPNIRIIAEVNHKANAASVNLRLLPTRLIFFGNPNLGTPLMQRNQLAGLDLPQKILVYQDRAKEVYAGFNNTTYLSTRHGLDGVASLPTIQGALTNLSTNASQAEAVAPEYSETDPGKGIITKTSSKSFEDAYNSLRNVIDANPNLRIVAEVDHQANAANVNLELRPTRLIIFGNPELGTPIMRSSPTAGIDLPQKILVWEDADGAVQVSYNDPRFLMNRHKIRKNRRVLQMIATALDNLSNVAAGN